MDVAIIGGGPAGSMLAILLARRGVSVGLIDRETFPRDKVCGEFLSYDALPVLEAIGVASQLDRLGAPRIDRCRVLGRGRAFEFALPEASRGISRFAFDRLLFETALAAGTQRLDGWNAELDGNRGLVLRRGDEERRLKARVLIGAWGRWGRMDHLLERRFVHNRSHRFFGFKRHYRRPTEKGLIELYSFRHGYLGVSLVENGMTNICGLVHHTRLSGLKGGWARLTADLAAEEPSLRKLFDSNRPVDDGFLSSEPVVFMPKSPVEEGILMIGDAAGLIDPLTGSGMAMALQSALIAAPAVLAQLAGSITSEMTYRDRFARFFGPRLRWSRRIALLLSRPGHLGTMLAMRPSQAAGTFLTARTRAGDRLLDCAIRDWFDFRSVSSRA